MYRMDVEMAVCASKIIPLSKAPGINHHGDCYDGDDGFALNVELV